MKAQESDNDRNNSHRRCLAAGVWVWVIGVIGAAAWAQSSSLYVDPSARPETVNAEDRNRNPLSPTIDRVSLVAVRPPAPRQYALHDLITIVVRETTQNDSKSSISTGKEFGINGEISEFPNLRLDKLLEFQLKPSDMDNGTPKIEMDIEKTFEGDGDYQRKDSFTTRITAEIIDVKPNGTLVLEARRFIKTDSESLQMTLTGICRKEDVTVNNTVLSTQLFDLQLDKRHVGELRRATQPGFLSKVLGGIFNF